MKYIFEVNVYTNGDFSLPFIPRGMIYDCEWGYSLRTSYTDRDNAINDILSICNFLKHNMKTDINYLKNRWGECIDSFINAIEESDSSQPQIIDEYMGGNYEGTEFKFYTEDIQYVNYTFKVTNEEYELIKNNEDITNEMIKEAIIDLYKSTTKIKFCDIKSEHIAIHFDNGDQLEKLVDYLKHYKYNYGTGKYLNLDDIKALTINYFGKNNQYLSLDRSKKHYPGNYCSCGKGYQDIIYEFDKIDWGITRGKECIM